MAPDRPPQWQCTRPYRGSQRVETMQDQTDCHRLGGPAMSGIQAKDQKTASTEAQVRPLFHRHAHREQTYPYQHQQQLLQAPDLAEPGVGQQAGKRWISRPAAIWSFAARTSRVSSCSDCSM